MLSRLSRNRAGRVHCASLSSALSLRATTQRRFLAGEPTPQPVGSAPLYEVRNYLFGKDPAQYACYRSWAQDIGVPALKGLLPHVGGEVVGFWLSTDSCPTSEVEGSEYHCCTPTNVTWVIRWPSKAARDAGWQAVDASPEYGAAKAKRKELCAAAGFTDGDAYRHVEVKFCVDVPTIATPPS